MRVSVLLTVEYRSDMLDSDRGGLALWRCELDSKRVDKRRSTRQAALEKRQAREGHSICSGGSEERARRHGAGQRRDVSQCKDFGGEPGLMAERARKAGPSQMHARTEPSMRQATTNRRPTYSYLLRGRQWLEVYCILSRATASGQRTCSRRSTRRDGTRDDQEDLGVREGASDWTWCIVLCMVAGGSLPSVALNTG